MDQVAVQLAFAVFAHQPAVALKQERRQIWTDLFCFSWGHCVLIFLSEH